MNEAILDDEHIENKLARRRDLLPTWIKVFVWIFLGFGVMVPIIIVLGLLGWRFELSLYGISTYTPFSIIGIIITLLFTLKAIVAFGLWTEKDWGPKLAIIDGILGVLVCIFVMILPLVFPGDNINFNFRLELALLIPYLLNMFKLKSEWEESNG